jgi:exonuclease SbcD
MRVLHTSDWHLGRSFHRESLLAAQGVFVDHLIETVRSERIDVVVVSGDVYDRALPSVDAVELCNQALRRLVDARVRTVLISGNHDSARRLGFGAELIDAAGVHLRTDPARVGEPVVIDDVAFYGIPYLEPELVRVAWELPERTHTAAIGHAMSLIHEDLRRRGTRSVVLAHAFVTGGQGSDSERDISVGGVAHVPVRAFDGVDYVALGHLHGPQRLAEHLRYSGSPLAYSFSEARHRKSVWLVDLDAGGLAGVERRELPVPRVLATVTGNLDELLTADEHELLADCYLSVELTDRVRPTDALRRLQKRFPHAVHVDWRPVSGSLATSLRYATTVRDRSDHDVACDFVTDCRGAEPTESESALLREAFAAVANDERAEPARQRGSREAA